MRTEVWERCWFGFELLLRMYRCSHAHIYISAPPYLTALLPTYISRLLVRYMSHEIDFSWPIGVVQRSDSSCWHVV